MNNDNNPDQTSGYSSSSSDTNAINPHTWTPQNDQMNSQENSVQPDAIPNTPQQAPQEPSSLDFVNPTYTGFQPNVPPKQDDPVASNEYVDHPDFSQYQNGTNDAPYIPYPNNQMESQYAAQDQQTESTQDQPAMSDNYAAPNYGYQDSQPEGTYPNAPYSQETTIPQRLDSKKPRKWLWGFAAIPILALAFILCFCFIPSFKAFTYRNLLGSTKYYEYIERSCPEKIIEQVKGNNIVDASNLKDGSKSESKLTFNLDPALKQSIGFDVDKLSCEMATASKDTRTTVTTSFKYDGNAIASMEFYTDTKSGKMYCRIPELSEKYIDYSALIASISSSEASSSLSSSGSLLDLSTGNARSHIMNCAGLGDNDASKEILKKLQNALDPQTIKKLINEYMKFLMDDLGKRGAIKLSKGDTYKIGDISQKCDKFTISLTQAQVKDVILDILNKVKKDKTIEKIVEDVTGLSSIYSATIDSVISKAKELNVEDNKNPVIKMEVYTDGKMILGRSITFTQKSDDFVTFEYGVVASNDKTIMQTSLYSTDKSYFTLIINSKKENDGDNGDLTLTIDDKNYTVTFENFKVTKENQIEGTLHFDQDNTNLSLEFATKDGKQNITFSGNISGTAIGSIQAETKREHNSSISVPEVSDSDIVALNSSDELVSFLKDSKLEQFLQTILTTFHIDEEITAKQLSDSIIYSVEHQVSLKDAMLKILGGEPASDPKTPSTTPTPSSPDDKKNNSGSAYKPEDYNLPSGTEITKDGDYSYTLTDDQLKELKEKGSDTKSFSKTKDDVYSAVETLAKSICGKDASLTTDVYNKVSGNVKNDSKYVSHFIELSWYSSSSYEDYVVLKYDSLNNQVIEVIVSTKKKSKVFSSLKDTCKLLGATAPSGDLETKVQSQINSKEDFSDITDLADSQLYLNVRKPSTEPSYYFRIGVKDN